MYSVKSYPKVNLFLKIVGKRGNYHEIFSRFLLVDTIYDEVSFVKTSSGIFRIDGFDFPQEQNIIYKIYKSLLQTKYSSDIKAFFNEYSVVVKKNIPQMAGLGGGSSNGAAFLNLVDEVLNLNMSTDEKISLTKSIGADIPFFVSGYVSAHVYGIGERIEPFEDESLKIDIFTPDISCDTGKVFRRFREKYYAPTFPKEWKEIESVELFHKLDIVSANDLYLPANELCNLPKIDGYLFSGSGSSFFKITE